MEKNKNSNNPFVIREGKLKDSQLKDSSYRSEWTEDSFIADNKSKEVIGRTFNYRNVSLIILFIVFLSFILVSKVAWLQVVKGEHYYKMAEGNRIRIKSVEPKRGIIYDRNLNSLVRNTSNFLLYLTPVDLPQEEKERDEIIRKISNILSNSDKVNTSKVATSSQLSLVSDSPYFKEIKDKLNKVKEKSLDIYNPVFVEDNIEYETAMKLYLLSEEIPGMVLSNRSKREYDWPREENEEFEKPTGLSLSHILGYTGKISVEELRGTENAYTSIDYIGKTGLEYFWESELKGKKGKKHIEVDALGKEKKVISQIEAEDGHNLVLSLDLDLQRKVEEILRKHLDKLETDKGSVVIMNPKNGEILSLVSWPAYDNNMFARGVTGKEYKELLDNKSNPLFNRSISGEFPSGSTIKPVIASAALEENIISENTTFNSVGGIQYSRWFFPDWKAGGHGLTDVRKSLAQSVNTFYYYIGGGYKDFQGLGIDKMVEYTKLFGLGSETGIDLPSEGDGFIPSQEWKQKTKDEPWYIGDTYNFAIGQGDILVTPLQVANFTSVFANKGNLYKPHLVKKIIEGEDKVIEIISPETRKENIIDDYNLEVVRQGMRQAVTQGSARFLNDLNINVAGKTGTAQWSNNKENHAWFTGFAPYENPELLITVLVEEGGEGSAVAVPITKDILRWYFNQKQ